jgi:hypothetical protein
MKGFAKSATRTRYCPMLSAMIPSCVAADWIDASDGDAVEFPTTAPYRRTPFRQEVAVSAHIHGAVGRVAG